MEEAVAWRRGQVSLDDVPLSTAAAEMNRYNARQIVIEDPRAAALRVNGLFQAGDSESFAHAVADAYGLDISEERDRIAIRSATHVN
jgi:transmembrane sensor